MKHPTAFLHAHIAPTSSMGCWVLSRDPKCYSRISHNMQNKSCLQRTLLLELPKYTAGKITSHFIIISLTCANYRGILLNQYSARVPCIKVLGLYTKLLRRNKVYILIIFILNNYGLWHNAIAILAQLLRSMSKQPLLIDVQILEWVVTA